MKKVNIKELTLINFRGHKELTIKFSEETTISGANRLGKSTISDAFSWLLFGKDQFDRKDFEIIPIIDGKKLDRVDSEVTGLIDFDGREMSLKRVLHQKWVRPRGQSVEKFDGCETLYYINDVPLKASEYKGRVDLMIEENVFKLITNPTAFLSLHWHKQREFLFQIAGTISDAEVLNKMATLTNKDAIINLTNILNSGKSLADYKKELSARKRKLNDDLETIQPRIDQTARLMPDNIDFSEIEREISLIDSEISKIDEQISDASKAIRFQYEEAQSKQRSINDLRTKQREVVNKANQEAQQNFFDNDNKKKEAESRLKGLILRKNNLNTELSDIRSSFSELFKKLKDKDEHINNLRELWNKENAKEYILKEGCLICPLYGNDCSDPIANHNHSTDKETAKIKFYENQAKTLQVTTASGVQAGSERDDIKKRMNELDNRIAELQDIISKTEAEEKEAQDLFNSIVVANPDSNTDPKSRGFFWLIIESELEEYQEIEAKIEEIKATIELDKPLDNSDLNNKKAELIASRDFLNKKLIDKDLIVKYKLEITRLETEASDIAQQIADVEKTDFAIADFTKAKIEECDRKINSLFEIVRFQLFDKTNEGNEFEACIPTNKLGVPISVTNTAERINAGLDIIRTLSSFYNVSAPIICDGAESVNQYLTTGSQMIYLRVTTEKVLTIN